MFQWQATIMGPVSISFVRARKVPIVVAGG
jgi:hypothetical protein